MTILIVRVQLYRFSLNIVQRERSFGSLGTAIPDSRAKRRNFRGQRVLQPTGCSVVFERGRSQEVRGSQGIRDVVEAARRESRREPWGARSGYVGPREERAWPARYQFRRCYQLDAAPFQARPTPFGNSGGGKERWRWRRDAGGDRATGWLSQVVGGGGGGGRDDVRRCTLSSYPWRDGHRVHLAITRQVKQYRAIWGPELPTED